MCIATVSSLLAKMVSVFYDHDAIAIETLHAFTSWMGSINLVTLIDSTEARHQSQTDD